jgi:hypothetical protein
MKIIENERKTKKTLKKSDKKFRKKEIDDRRFLKKRKFKKGNLKIQRLKM